MATVNQDVIRTLNDLTQTIKDSEEGYRTAADGTRDADTRALFQRYAEQRHGIGEELKQCIRSLGAEPAGSRATPGRAYRIWTTLKSHLSSDDTLAMLKGCERGEDFTRREFQEALDTGLPREVRPAVENLYARVRAAHDEVKALRDQRQQRH
jgi:uncharacterized protein (TIGR02284 family)